MSPNNIKIFLEKQYKLLKNLMALTKLLTSVSY